MFWSECPDISDVGRISTLIDCRDKLCVTQFSWLRRATPNGKSPVYQFGLIFGLISNRFRNFYTSTTLKASHISQTPGDQNQVDDQFALILNREKQQILTVGKQWEIWFVD